MLYLILLILSLLFFYKTIDNGWFFKMPIFVSYAFSIIIFNVLGSYYVFYPDTSTALVRDIFLTSPTFEKTFFLILFLQLISFFIFIPIHQNTFYPKEKKIPLKGNLKKYMFTLFSVSLLIILFFLTKNGIPPFFTVGIGELTNSLIISERVDFFQNIDNFWLISFGFYFIPSIISVLLFLQYKQEKSYYNFLFFLSYFVFAMILSLSFLHKTPLVFLVTQIFLASIIYDQKISLSKVFYFCIGALIFIFSLYLFSFSGEYYVHSSSFIFTSIIESIFQRLFIIYSLSLSVVPELVYNYGFLEGKAGIINPLGLFNFEQFNLQKELHLLLYGFPGNNPPPASGYAYANYGLLGVFGLIFTINLLIYMYQSFCNYINNKFLSIFVTIFFSIKAISLSMTSIWDNLLMPQELFLLMISLSIYYLIPNYRKQI